MDILNKIALCFVVLYSFIIILNTHLGEYERIQSNVAIFFLNGFAYVISAMERENDHTVTNS